MQRLGFILVLIACLTSAVFPQSVGFSTKRLKRDSSAVNHQMRAAVRSAVLPGWGQFYNKQPKKAWRTWAVDGACIGGAVAFSVMHNSLENDFNQYIATIGKSYSLWALGSAVVISTVDAYCSALPDTAVGKNPTGAMLRSIFIPGWGQFYNEKPLKGLLIAGTQVTFLSNALIFDKWGQQADNELDKAYYYDNRSLYYWLLGASILYSMTDAFVDAHLYDFDDSPDLSVACRHMIDPFTGVTTPLWNISLAVHF